MAKNSFPVMSPGRSITSKAVTALVMVALAVIVVRYPTDAAHFVASLLHLAGNVISGFVTFMRQFVH